MNGNTGEFPKPEVLNRLAVSESGFVFDPVTGNSFTLNATGLAILKRLQHGDDLDALVGALAEEFDVETQDAERDVIEFSASLRSAFK